MHNQFRKVRPLRYGMIGGGATSQIGDSHRVALAWDHCYDLVAGAFDINPEQGKDFGAKLGLDAERVYVDYQEMAKAEAARPDGVEVVGIMTPNFTHHTIARAFLEAGVHVILEKPITTNLQDARDLIALARKQDLICASMYGYSGYPMIRQARAMVRNGDLGAVRVVQTEFAHGNCAVAVEQHSAGAKWRNDPAQSGATFVLGDIGTHALHLATYITGQTLTEVSCDRQCFVEGRTLEDNAHVLMHFSGGASGFLWASGVAVGHRHGLAIRVYGSDAGIEWHQERPNQLHYARLGESPRLLELDSPELYPETRRLLRVGAGHPEGYFEAFTNVYSDVAESILARNEGRAPEALSTDFPTLEQGAEGVRFLEACVESSTQGSRWVDASLKL
jgi:predicted dehydrogenase